MGNPFTASQLKAMRQKKKEKEAKLSTLMDRNNGPMEAVENTTKNLPTLRPQSTGDPVKDMVGINHQLNHLPEHFSHCDERQLREAWEGADRIGRAAAWIKGHILLTLDRKYKEEAVKNFAQEQGITKASAYNYIHLAEMFPKVDPVLEPSFHFKAISLAHGDRQMAIQLIEKAKERKLADPKYSFRDFVKDAGMQDNAKEDRKPLKIDIIAGKTIKDLKILLKHPELSRIPKDIQEITGLANQIELAFRKEGNLK